MHLAFMIETVTVLVMKENPFNICPTCVHKDTCVLTQQKSQVWSCSEYDEKISVSNNTHNLSVTTDGCSEMEMA